MSEINMLKFVDKRSLLLSGLGIGGLLFLPKDLLAQDLSKILNAINGNSNNNNPTVTSSALGLPTGVTTTQADSGIRQALTNGAIASVLKLGKLDGYWADGQVKIPLPNPLRGVQRNLQPLGLSRPLDDLQLKVNRAAETAAPQARDIFVNAIRSFTITDVVNVLRGGNTAGTDLLREKSKPSLMTLFRPPMANAVNTSGAGRAFDRVSSNYGSQLQALGGLRNIGANNGVQTSRNASPKDQFIDFSVSKGLDGLFYYIGQEEMQIRQNPASRTTDLLRSVFGNL